MKYLALTCLLILTGFSYSQTTPAVFDNATVLREGVYTSYSEVLQNTPRFPDCSINYSTDLLGIIHYEFTMASGKVTPDTVFALLKHGILFICYTNEFYKVIIRGAVSIFNKQLTYSNFLYTQYAFPVTFTEDNIFLVDFTNGKINRLSVANVDELLKNDPVIYKEFSALSKGKKRKSLYPYIIKYNNRNKLLME
jgi:hypothetical protein